MVVIGNDAVFGSLLGIKMSRYVLGGPDLLQDVYLGISVSKGIVCSNRHRKAKQNKPPEKLTGLRAKSPMNPQKTNKNTKHQQKKTRKRFKKVT